MTDPKYQSHRSSSSPKPQIKGNETTFFSKDDKIISKHAQEGKSQPNSSL